MPRSKPKSKAKTEALAAPSSGHIETVFKFPYLQYASLLGTYVVLVCFAGLALPSSSKWLGFRSLPQLSSVDRPQHPFLNPITSNPAGTVVTVSVGIFGLTVWWAGWVRLWWAQEKRLTRIENHTERVQSKISAMKSAAFLTLVGANVYYSLIVLFGAPLLSHSTTTMGLAILLSVLTVYTPAYTLPLPDIHIPISKLAFLVPKSNNESDSLLHQLTWLRLFSEVRTDTAVERVLVYPVLGSIFGCLIGAIPLALDWDRPWQAWPLLPAYGAIIGHVTGSIAAMFISGWKRLVELGQRA